MLRDAWSAIAAGQPDAAFSCISTLPLDMPAARNARAVCLMMQGEYQRALDLLRPMIFPEDGLVMDPDADPAWRANFVLALLRAGSQDGFRTYADQLEPADHPAVRAIRNLLSPPSRKGLGRFLGFLGGPPLVALPRDFPAGWPESELQENRDNSGPAGVTVPGSSAVGVAVRPLSSGKAPGLTMAFATARPPAIVWKARPIFISSTFRDMHAERDWLRENAFLRLGERLRERCHYLDAIDLRQGVENASEQDEAKREMQVLKVCLDEIERSKPFLVALIGDRYGWVPPADRIVAAARAAGLPTSIDVAGRSVTELEILFGVLENADQRKRSWFFFRNLDRATMPPEVAARFPAEAPSDDPESPAGRLRTLKDRIRREIPERVLEYPLRWDSGKGAFVGLEELDKRIEEALWSDLDAETAVFLRHTPRTWQEADARAVGDFVTERTRGYVERPAVTDPMLAHAASPPSPGADWGLIITGAPGNGKSSLFGHVYGALQSRAEAGEIVLLAHAAGIYPMSGQVDRMLRRWVTELSAALGQPDPLDGAESQAMQHPDGSSKFASADIETTFASLLDQAAAARRVVVLVDALNQFEPTLRAQYMTWLPRSWPANARFIATAVAGRATSALTDRPRCREQLVPPVSIEEAREIARRFYRERHHRDVNPRALATLLEKKLPDGRPAHGNPLWLALALQEMNLLEADDFERAAREYANLSDAARMDALQVSETSKLPADVPGVYGELLSRAERNWGKAWTDAFIGLTAVSRAGWRESDLRALMPRISGQAWDELAFAGIRRALGTHVVQRGAQAQWDFSHATLRDAVLDRYLADQAARRHLHGLIVDHLESLPSLPAADPVRITETMVHLLCFGDQDRAAAYVAYVAGPQKYFNPSATGEAVAVLVDAIQEL